MIFIFWLQTDMNLIFQTRYCRTFNENLQQRNGPSKFAVKNYQDCLISFIQNPYIHVRPRVHPLSWQTLKACNFAVLQSKRLHSTSSEKSDSYLFGARRSSSQQGFKDNLCPLKQPLLYFIKWQKNEFFCKALYYMDQQNANSADFKVIS